jgi:hypothetical protein
MNTRQKVTEVIESAKRRNLADYDFQMHHSLAQSYPDGEKAYFERETHELKKRMKDDTIFGYAWIVNYCPGNILESEWLYMCADSAIKHMDEGTMLKQLALFLDQYSRINYYQDCIKNTSTRKAPRSELNHRETGLQWYYSGKVADKKVVPAAIYNWYIHYSDTENRLCSKPGFTNKKLRLQRKRIGKILPCLDKKGQEHATSDLKIIEKDLEERELSK